MKKQALLCAVVSIVFSPSILADSSFRGSRAIQSYSTESQEVPHRLGQMSVVDTPLESLKCELLEKFEKSSKNRENVTSPKTRSKTGAVVGG